MLFIFSIIMFSISYLEYKKNRWCPMTLFGLLWANICFFYSLKLFEIYDVDDLTQIAIILGVIFFTLGYCVADKFVPVKCIKSDNRKMTESGYFFVKILIAADIIYQLPKYVVKIQMLLSQGWSLMNAKAILTEGMDVFSLYIFDPFNFFLIALVSYLIIYDRSQIFIIISGLILNIFTFLSTGSRARVLFFVISLLSMIMIRYRNEIVERFRRKIKIIVGLSMGIILLASGLGIRLVRSAYFYLCTCVPLLDGLITKSDSHFTGGLTYGTLSFNGFLRIFPNAIQNWGNKTLSFPTFDKADLYIYYFEYAKNVSPDERTNSFYSFIGQFYLDFGFWGIIVCSMLFGIIVCCLYNSNCEKNNAFSKVLIAFLQYAMLFSMVRFQWMGIRFAIGFLYIIFFGFLGRFSLKGVKLYYKH